MAVASDSSWKKEAVYDDLRNRGTCHHDIESDYRPAHLPKKIGQEHKKARQTVTNFDGLV